MSSKDGQNISPNPSETMAPSVNTKQRALAQKNKDLQEQLDKMQKKLEVVTKNREVVVTKYAPSASKTAAVKEAAYSLYRNYKFIADEAEARAVANQCAKFLKLDFDSEEARASWVEVHLTNIMGQITNGCNYTGSRYWEAALA